MTLCRRAAPALKRTLAALCASLAMIALARPAVAGGSEGKGGAPGTRRDFPCPSCITIAPPSYAPDKPAPLLVALHGDEGATRVVLRAWKAALEKRGILFLALRCPKELGCENSFWRWRGDPAWIMAQVDAVEAAYNVERARIYLSGWSGGSTYIGIMAPSLSPRFAAINLNGGGAGPPQNSPCAPYKAPVYHFMGGRNPLLSFAEAAREHFTRCGHELTWDFAPALDHAGELAAFTGGAVPQRVLAWLENKQNTGAPPPAQTSAAEPPAAAAPSPPPDPAPPPSGSPKSAELNPNTTELKPSTPPSPGGCGCHAGSGAPPASIAALFIAAAARARRARGRKATISHGHYDRTARTSPPPKRAM